MPSSRVPFAVGIATAALTAAVIAVFWGFTVDDALITVRYAARLARGLGASFNLGEPPSDGVTPLPWLFLVASIACDDAWKTLDVLRWLGAFTVVVSNFVLARTASTHVVQRRSGRIVSIFVIAVMPAAAAWASAGMETGFVISICALLPLPRCGRMAGNHLLVFPRR
jgi:hypothetical protein